MQSGTRPTRDVHAEEAEESARWLVREMHAATGPVAVPGALGMKTSPLLGRAINEPVVCDEAQHSVC